MSKWDIPLLILGVGSIAAFVLFTDPGKRLLAQVTGGGSQYDPKTSSLARGKKGGPMGLEDAREFIPEFIDDLVDPDLHGLKPFSGAKVPAGYKGTFKQ